MMNHSATSDKRIVRMYQSRNCWVKAGISKGNYSFLVHDCAQFTEASCFYQVRFSQEELVYAFLLRKPFHVC